MKEEKTNDYDPSQSSVPLDKKRKKTSEESGQLVIHFDYAERVLQADLFSIRWGQLLKEIELSDQIQHLSPNSILYIRLFFCNSNTLTFRFPIPTIR